MTEHSPTRLAKRYTALIACLDQGPWTPRSLIVSTKRWSPMHSEGTMLWLQLTVKLLRGKHTRSEEVKTSQGLFSLQRMRSLRGLTIFCQRRESGAMRSATKITKLARTMILVQLSGKSLSQSSTWRFTTKAWMTFYKKTTETWMCVKLKMVKFSCKIWLASGSLMLRVWLNLASGEMSFGCSLRLNLIHRAHDLTLSSA